MASTVSCKYNSKYSVSSEGVVYSTQGLPLKPSTRNSYLSVSISNKSYKKSYTIHRLVAEHFLDNPENKPTVNHIDGDKHNNNVSNLEWATLSEQQNHALDNGLRYSYRILTEEMVIDICKLSIRQAVRKYKTAETVIMRIKNRELFQEWTADQEINRFEFTKPMFTIEQVQDIRTSGLTGSALARKYNTSPQNISRIKSGERYKEAS